MTQTPDLTRILKDSRIVAVVGFKPDPTSANYFVPEYLQRQGYTIIPVNPGFVGETHLNAKVAATLAEIGTPVDVVQIFRQPERVGDHLQDILNMQPHPKVVWMQLGIQNEAVAQTLRSAGIEVVQDTCMLAEHRSRLSAGIPT